MEASRKPLAKVEGRKRMRLSGLTVVWRGTPSLDDWVAYIAKGTKSKKLILADHSSERKVKGPANTHLPSGTVLRAEVAAHSAEYEAAIKAAGGIDLQLLGIGKTGHIGFNEPGSGSKSRTRLVTGPFIGQAGGKNAGRFSRTARQSRSDESAGELSGLSGGDF